MKKAPKKAAAAKSKTTTKMSAVSSRSKKVVAGKKKFSLSPFQKRLGIIVAIMVLVAGLAGAYAVYQSNVSEAAGCMSKKLVANTSSICTRYFLLTAEANGTNYYKDASGKHTVKAGSRGTMFGSKTSKVAKQNGISGGTINSVADWNKVCSIARSAIKTKSKSLAAYRSMGCSSSGFSSAAQCKKAGWKDIENGKCTDTAQKKASDYHNAPDCRSHGFHWKITTIGAGQSAVTSGNCVNL